jgi:hypothetical protein
VADNSNPRKSEREEQEVSVKWKKLDNVKPPSNAATAVIEVIIFYNLTAA